MEKQEKTSSLICKTWRTKTVAAVLAVLASVALPQIFHGLGYLSGLGSGLGEAFLPMHLAIFLVGYFAGTWAGLVAGAVSPLLSFALTSLLGSAMPAALILPFMTVELAVYGMTTGLFAERTKLPTILTLLLAQIFGRAARALALVVGVYAFSSPVALSTVWTSIVTGLPGLVLQWAVVPLLVFWGKERGHDRP